MKTYWGYLVGAVVVVIIGFYIYWQNTSATPVAVAPSNTPATDTSGQGTPSSSNSGGSTGVGVSVGVSSTVTTSASGYKDGSYTGSVADAVYGKLQVAVTISGGKITEITWPVYPNDGGHTVQISASALPTLKQEAIASQSANVNVVSGATQTSEAFQQSLAAALAQANS